MSYPESHFQFRPTSLFNTIVMLGHLAGGLGMIARSLAQPVTATGRERTLQR